MASRATELRIALAAFGLLAVLFVAFPQIDLWASGLFYRGDGQWVFGREDLILAIPYRGLSRLGHGLLVVLLILLVLGCFKRFNGLRAKLRCSDFYWQAPWPGRSCWSTTCTRNIPAAPAR